MLNPQHTFLLPGWQNSSPAHWQSRWEALHGYVRVEQSDWMQPRRGDWMARLDDVVAASVLEKKAQSARHEEGVEAPHIVLVAHSLGCHLVAAWAAHSRYARHIQGAFLVAPGDAQQPDLQPLLPSWSPPVLQALPFPGLLLGSQNDPYCSFERARQFATSWGAQFMDYGHCGHINADVGLGDWPQGHALLTQWLQERTQ